MAHMVKYLAAPVQPHNKKSVRPGTRLFPQPIIVPVWSAIVNLPKSRRMPHSGKAISWITPPHIPKCFRTYQLTDP